MTNNIRVSNRKQMDITPAGVMWVYYTTRFIKGRELSIAAYISQYDIVNNRLLCAQKLRQNRAYLAKLVTAYNARLVDGRLGTAERA